MAKTIKIILLALFTMIFMQAVTACMHMPAIAGDSEECFSSIRELARDMPRNISDIYQWENETAVNNFKASCELTDSEFIYIKEKNLKLHDVKQQTDEEYRGFLKTAKKERRNLFNDRKMISIDREGEWTSYRVVKKFSLLGASKRC